MVQIVLNDEQLEILNRACEPVVVVDRSGSTLGRLIPPQSKAIAAQEGLDSDIALALQRMNDAANGGTFYSTEQVLDRLQALEQK